MAHAVPRRSAVEADEAEELAASSFRLPSFRLPRLSLPDHRGQLLGVEPPRVYRITIHGPNTKHQEFRCDFATVGGDVQVGQFLQHGFHRISLKLDQHDRAAGGSIEPRRINTNEFALPLGRAGYRELCQSNESRRTARHGSISAMRGSNNSLRKLALNRFSGQPITALRVTSAPVPAVVGTAIQGAAECVIRALRKHAVQGVFGDPVIAAEVTRSVRFALKMKEAKRPKRGLA